ASTLSIQFLELICLLPLSRFLLCFILFLGIDSQGSPARCRSRTMLANRTGQAILDVKYKVKVGSSAPGLAFITANARLSVWAGDLSVLPVNVKLSVVKSALDAI